jgi:hypothetical protein
MWRYLVANHITLAGIRAADHGYPFSLIPQLKVEFHRFAARLLGLAFGLALAVRPAGLAEVSGVNGAPQARPAQRDAKHR